MSGFQKILIANRGEIAVRVMRTARAMGYRTVAVYSTADADAEHVRQADQAVCIGEALPAQSYLNIAAVIEAARTSGADAVHPGYGFLAENAAFAQACRDAGLVFIGPSPDAIRAMGDKAGAKRLMQAAGVPCIPGFQGEDQRAATLAAEAARIGWPVMIKATAGGGGRGMRLVSSAAQFDELLRSAQSEALNAFGDATVILERAIVAPRHIEVQVFADRHGHAIHLGERDCSVQRRHQKVIEEAPSPAVSEALRERMGATAVAAAKAIGYEGAGTLEFLLDAEGQYWFMEMNTRLQVEHPVTEAVTGLDLVELQLRVAAGEPLPITQQQVRISGHAIEVRLCAEDPQQGFMPQSGTLAAWRPSPVLRTEHALRDGAAVPPFYDSMIAKLVAHGRTRDEARHRLVAGLRDTVALGIATNQALLQRALSHPVFARGEATTAFIADHVDALLAPDAATDTQAALLAALLLQLGERGWPSPLAHTLPNALRFSLDGVVHAARVTPRGKGAFDVALDDRPATQVALLALQDHGALRFACGGLAEQAMVVREPGRAHFPFFHFRGRAFRLDDLTHVAVARAGDGGGDGLLRASMNGRVIALLVAEGDAVAAGQPLVTLEAMKMEHVHCAPRAGRVALHVAVGAQVAARHVVAEVSDAAEATDVAAAA
ncbi:acetyl-CoA carboxylase biotin carboxylase subunit [Variovorax sp. J22G73]|uniref:acetyl/propionyl/methylcrotonyl-CoA carboxylase subunit alpha n=1 Tax=unclassified Variovorax TaxID=663243 RepID=UPI000D5F3FE8|nr:MULTISPECIES: acetyl-CoA carboxylase biotin carboxylase subunit [unclassified Variovorax]MDM0007639.1 acetyl-CoA carboxylase biotin carboxylase subunit [Variovorax sp. J22R203]MDM0100001.1 acetyl-CoA carboxylase biotin carboxylase subunit [Variovorax sp. J22G73]